MSDEIEVCIYDRVTLLNGQQGEVVFMGIIQGKNGIFYGIKLDGPQGKNNGSFENVKYFECFDNYGVFVTANKIKHSEPTQLNQVLPRACIGDRVYVKNKRQHGTLKFVGIVDFADGCWYGVELEEPMGENNGTSNGRLYFECMDYYGVFCQSKDIQSKRAARQTQKKALTVKKTEVRAKSDLSQIKKNYQQQQQQQQNTAMMEAPPPPMPEPESQKNEQNLLEQDPESMGFIQLKARCGMEGLSTFGTKKQLLSRLRAHLNKDANPNGNDKNSNINNNNNNAASPPNTIHQPQPQQPQPQPQQQVNMTKSNSNSNRGPSNGANLWEDESGLHEIDPDKDDFFTPILGGKKASDASESDASRGSVVFNRSETTKVNPTSSNEVNTFSPMGTLPDGDEEENDSDEAPNNAHSQQLPSQPTSIQKAMSHTAVTTPSNVNATANGNNTSTSTATATATGTGAAASDWIMLPDPKSGKMYYANLKTKETRWQPPPGFGVTESNLNPGYDPQWKFKDNATNAVNASNPQQYSKQQIWQQMGQTKSTSSLANAPAANPAAAGFMNRQLSPFVSATNFNSMNYQNNAEAFQNNRQWASSAMNFGGNPPPQSLSPQQSPQIQPKAVPPQQLNKQPSVDKGGGGLDALAALEAAKWKKATDKTTGREYWYHKDTKVTSWEPPAVVKKMQQMNAENAVGGLNAMEDIGKAEWEEDESGSDVSSSGSYYSDGGSEEEESEEDGDQQNQQQYQPQPAGFGGQPSAGFPQYPYGAQQPAGGFPAQPAGYNPYGAGGQFGAAGGFNPNTGGYSPVQPQMPSPVKQDSAREMYTKPNMLTNHEEKEEKAAEDNPWISAEEAKSRVIVRDTLKRYWQIGAEQSFKLDEWAKQNYQLGSHKKGIFGKKQQSIGEILKYSDFSKMKTPLNKASSGDEKLKEQCMQTWKNINSYMGVRKSGKSSEGHVEKLVRYALKGDDNLRNEIYCQLAKQCTKNPNSSKLLKGWKLMLICCSFFPPSDQFVDYLACFIWTNTQQPTEIGQYAIKALHALDATMLSGGRKFPPLPLEIVKLENLQPIPLNIYFINGMKCKQVLVTSQTRAKQVLETLAQTFNFKHPEAFGLYEMEPNIPALDKMKKHYIKRELMSQQEKINDLIRMPFERELEDDDRMLDVIASWLKRDQSKRRKGKDGGDPKKKAKHKSTKNVRFVLKVKTYRKSMEKTFSHMGAKANYLTHVWHVVNDFYPISVEDEEFAFDLAALQLQGTYGPKPTLNATQVQSKFGGDINTNNQDTAQKAFYKQGLIAYDLHRYLPQVVLKKYLPGDRNSCEAKILQFRMTKYSNMSRADCWLRYAKMLRSHKKFNQYFGSAWYRGVRIQGDAAQPELHKQSTNDYTSSKGNSKSIVQTNRNSNDLLVGINEHAITFVNPITQSVVERYQMEEILTFGYRSNAFLFVAGTLMTQTKIQIATMHGKAMNRLVRTHIDLRVRDAEKKGQKANIQAKPNDI
eukprot:CAMPEP_0197036816 /NCGR_PEP_ID=MMETSP1384-20130603/14199_1 /TAXON_ID=29189 /ORGANISM="Ammonia sp." /LENGTH=1484 /DNA_ID=CAMNT_0042467033 /DNA_START=103 /DNA_END=4557 /DNA_ORIENTATION=+